MRSKLTERNIIISLAKELYHEHSDTEIHYSTRTPNEQEKNNSIIFQLFRFVTDCEWTDSAIY